MRMRGGTTRAEDAAGWLEWCLIVASGHSRSSEKRAASVKAHLVGHGMAADRIATRGMGEDQPVANNDTREGRANNRRVEIVVKAPARPSSTNQP